MGNVTSNLIENALQSQSTMSSPSVSTAESLLSTASSEVQSSDSKLREQIRLLATDSTKLELYRLLQQEMEKQTNCSTSDGIKEPEKLKTEETPTVNSDSLTIAGRANPTSSSASSVPLCPKKKFLKEYRFDEPESPADCKTPGAAPPSDSNSNVGTADPVVVSVAADGTQLSVRSRSYTVSLPVRSRGPVGNASSKPGEQHHHQNQSRESSGATRQPLEGLSRAPQTATGSEVRSSYVIDREHGPASSVAAYNVARQQSRREESGTPSMNPARASRHAAVSGEHELQVWPGPNQNYYYVDQNKVGERSGADGGIVANQPHTKEQRSRQQPGPSLPTSAVGYRFENTGPPTMTPSWRHVSDPASQSSRASMAPRVGPSSTWSGPQHQQPPEMYPRNQMEQSKDYEAPGGRVSKYRIVDAPQSTMPTGYQYNVAARSATYEQQKTGYSSEGRKYVPVDVSRAAYPQMPNNRRGGNGDFYDTARRQVHEQIETICALPPPLFKQHPQRSNYSGGPVSEPQRSSSQQVGLPRPLEPVEPSVRPKLAGLMHSDGGPSYDRVPPTDARMLMSRSAGGQPRDRDEREYDAYASRQSRPAATFQQHLVPNRISPSASHHRVHQGSESLAATEPTTTSVRHHQSIETPLDLSFHKEEPGTMTAEAFLRRVQDPQHFAVTRHEYSLKGHYGGNHDIEATETELLRQSELRRAEYRHQQMMAETSASSSAHQLQQSPRNKLETVPDWVSSRAAPIGHLGGQQQHQHHQQQRGTPTSFIRRQVLNNSPVGASSYGGISPGESRMHQHPELMSTAAYVDARVLSDASSEEAAASWERQMHVTERPRMQAASWESGSSRNSSAMQQSSDSRTASLNSSKASKFENRSSFVSQQPGNMMSGNRMSNPLPQSGGLLMSSSMAYESRQQSRSLPGHSNNYTISSGSQPSSTNLTMGSASLPGVSSMWMSKEKQERLARQDRIVVSESMMPAESEIRRARSFESQARMIPFDSLLPVSRASSPSLPQLSPVPSSVSMSANAAANRRIPIVQLLGSHSPSDILHLRCNVCSSTYGSLRSFRMHFAKVHGLEPGPEHFTIQTISETRTAIARSSGNQQDSTMLDCLDDSSLPPPSLLCETEDPVIVSETRRSMPMSVDSSLTEQLPRRETMAPVKQVAEVYPIPKKSSPIIVVTRDLSSTPEKPSPPIGTIAKPSSLSSPIESSHLIRCHRCYQFSTHDWALYRRHIKMHGPPSVDELPAGKSPTITPDGGDVDATSEAGCEICLEGFSDVADWQSHITKSHFSSQCMMRSCACKSCDVGFTNAGALRRHLAAVHGVVSSSSMKSGDVAVVDVEYRCLFCPEAFSDERSLYVHTQAHEHHYMLQRSTSSSSMPLSRRYAFMHSSMQPSPNAVHRVQTAVPDTTCPEDQRPSGDSAVSAGNSKSGSDDGSSLSSEKSPRNDPVEETSSSRNTTTSVNVSKNAVFQMESKPRGDSLKASILRRLSAYQETCDEPSVPTSDNDAASAANAETLSVKTTDEQGSVGSLSPGSDRSSKTVMGDFVTRMHQTVENSLRGFSVSQPSGCTQSTVDSLSPSSSASAPNHRVRDLCDRIIANSFRQGDDALPQTWPSTGDYLGELSRRSPSDEERRTSPSSDVQVFGGRGRSLGFDDIARQPVRSDCRSSPRFDKDLMCKLSASSPAGSEPVVGGCQTNKRSDVDDGMVLSENERCKLSKSDDVACAGSDSEQTANDLDLFDDEPPLYIDLNHASSDEEDGAHSPAATGPVDEGSVEEDRDVSRSDAAEKHSDGGERSDKSPKKRRLAEALADKLLSGSNPRDQKRHKSSAEYSSA